MDIRRGIVTMMGQNTDEIERQRLGDAVRNLRPVAIEYPRRQVGKMLVTREEIRTEEQLAACAIQATVSVGMPRKMDDFQSMPDVQFIAVVEQARGSEFPESQKGSPDRLQPTRDPRSSAI